MAGTGAMTNKSEDWDEAAYWERFEQAQKALRRRDCYVCDDPSLCGCVNYGPFERRAA